MRQESAAKAQDTDPLDMRASPRVPLQMPVLIHAWGRQHSAKVHNISRGGAMVEAGLPVSAGNHILFSCGSIETLATIAWKSCGFIGVKFRAALDEERIAQQAAQVQSPAKRGKNA